MHVEYKREKNNECLVYMICHLKGEIQKKDCNFDLDVAFLWLNIFRILRGWIIF